MYSDLEKKYIELSRYYYYNKYFYKLILEKKYLENFGDIELSKMKNIYETMIINKKLEDMFFLAVDNSIQYSNLIEYRARKEFFDLNMQIKDLEKKIKVNSRSYKELKFFLDKGLEDAIEKIIKKTSPYMNKSKKAKAIWLEFLQALEDKNFKRVFRLSNSLTGLRRYRPDIQDQDLERDIEEKKSQIIDMKNRFPFTKIGILEDEKSIKVQRDQDNRDVDNMKESYEKMADIYLSSSLTPSWYS
ncbi:MAG: hypothetical protein Q4E50_01690 [Tissierellia bacterium]|nr:hypothetical protein [Tissierellia bacterium]